ncbi:MAG: IS1595 family transposase [Terracidiphilus sp.]
MEKQLPKSLIEAIRYFADPDVCVEFVASMRWPDGVVCPHCEGKRVSYLKSRRIWKCMAKDCHKQFSVKTFSVFEDSPIPLDKWLTAVWLVVNCKNGISSYELARDLKVTQKSAWFMLHRIRLALKNGFFERMGSSGGPIEADECYIGGKPKNMHAGRRMKLLAQYGEHVPKPAVFGMLDRETRQVRATVFAKIERGALMCEILNNAKQGVPLFTDQHKAYDYAQKHFIHETVNHMKEYVRGEVHTNGIENFWSLLKRGLSGTYVSVEPFHLSRYVDEQAFRFNNRATKDNPLNDADRFALAVSQIAGKRLTYAELTGKVGETTPEPF